MPTFTPRLTQQLAEAYLDTNYIVDNRPNSFHIRVNVPSRQLQALHTQHNVNCSAYLTACNPYSQALSTSDNNSRMTELAKEITGRWPFLTGMGQDREGRWPGEPSYLIIGISEEDAHTLALKYEQFAYLCCKSGTASPMARARLSATDSYDNRIIRDAEEKIRSHRRDQYYQGIISPDQARVAGPHTLFCRPCAEKAFAVWEGWCTYGMRTMSEARRAKLLSLPDIPETPSSCA
jgi:Protein of unknown function (DUF3293)